jgi:hypothetical protein
MTRRERAARAVLALNGGDPYAPIHRDALREITRPLFQRTGANGALFGFARPWMTKVGEERFFTDAGRSALGV